MDETGFWALIEEAWSQTGNWEEVRNKFLQDGSGDSDDLVQACDEMIPHLQEKLEGLDQDGLLAFDQILERKLYHIDRSEIVEFTDGSDDGFLYSRGFIVAMGRDYYQAVDATPSRALMNAECEDMCFLSSSLYEDRFGDLPDSGISRESASNPDGGW